MTSERLPLFVKRDLDGFFGLFVDNLVQLLLIVSLAGLCGFTGEHQWIITTMVLPGAAVSLLLGNLFYAWQAHRLAKRERRNDVTALPYGINTPSLLVYVFFVVLPAAKDGPVAAWTMGLIACLGSGLIEFIGAFFAGFIRKRTPRAALLSTLAGIAVGFISMKFAIEIFQRPLVAMVPLGIILVTYFSKVRLPLGLPGGFLAVVVGTGAAWLITVLPEGWLSQSLTGPPMDPNLVAAEAQTAGWYLPIFVGDRIWDQLINADWMPYLSVIIPMGLFNLIGSLQNIESAEAAGDRYHTGVSLGVNGLGTMAAACFGSCFPTTIYIGHPGWKGLGARAGYSTLNGIVISIICLTGTVTLIGSIVPLEAGIAIVLWIGIIIVAQAFSAVEKKQAPAVAIGLFPAIAAWGATVVMGAFFAGQGRTIQAFLEGPPPHEVNGFLVHGMILMERGFIFTCMILAGVSACLIDRKFTAAAIWSLIGAALTWLGLMHAYLLNGNQVDYLFRFDKPGAGSLAFRADGVAIGYLLFGLLFFGISWLRKRGSFGDVEE